MTTEAELYTRLTHQAYRALGRGDRTGARNAAQKAVALDPRKEEAWLILGAVASPRASLVYLRQALRINPGSHRAREGLRWAQNRLRPVDVPASLGDTVPTAALPPAPPRPIQTWTSRRARVKTRAILWSWVLVMLLTAFGFALWFAPRLPLTGLQDTAVRAMALAGIAQASQTPTQTNTVTATFTASPSPTEIPPTPTHTASPSATPTNTAIPTATPTLTPSNTPTPLPTETPTEQPRQAKNKKKKKKNQQASGGEQYQFPGRPERVSADERWIDVDLSTQTTHAYEGDTLVRSFLVSTGTWQTPTVTGTYRIYVKYVSTDMWGADYYLSGVPYVMYFYEGYGLHGTYWHNNFGTPMSHGCVNLRPEDAAWLFDFASVGTVVNVHY